MGSSGTFAVMAAAALAAAPLLGYDLHTRALTPIVEKPVPEGGAVTLVEDGRLRFAIETDD
ncbi:MAG: hypothetical protein IJP66_06590, partial [Kiritimatiellae bacterium]|nr:hypothetical protein [Kiritimatiellia bacterium]